MNDLSPRDRLVREMELRLMAEVGRRRRRTRRTKWLAFSATGLLLGAAAVSAWSWLATPFFGEHGAHCYSAPDTSASYVEAGLADRDPDGEDTGTAPAQKALELCRGLWQSGALGDPETGTSLIVCRDNDGSFQVFPYLGGGPATCRALGTNEPEK